MVSATVRAEGDMLVIEPDGRLSKFASLARKIEVPLACIKEVSAGRAEIRGGRLAARRYHRTLLATFTISRRAGFSTRFQTGTGASR